jgi:hypothetical protein
LFPAELQNRLEDEDRAPRVDERTTMDRLERKIARLHLKLEMEQREDAERQKRIQGHRGIRFGVGPECDARFQYGSNTRAGSVRVSSEPLTYEPDSPHSIFRDMWQDTRFGDQEARARLQRHRQEMKVERRDCPQPMA